jgi:hypothetical protein
MNPLEAVILKMMSRGGTYSPYGMYPPYMDKNGNPMTTFTTGVSDDAYEYVVPGVKGGKIVDPYGEFVKSGDYFARFNKGPLGRALGKYYGNLVHKWQEENNLPEYHVK